MRPSDAPASQITRRRLLVTGGLGVGLVVGWAVWPRDYRPNLVVRRGEHLFGPYLKIAEDGRVIVAVPQVETGQGVYTTLPQIVADELGADWRTVAVEPAPINPLYANRLFATELAEGVAPRLAEIADTFATRSATMVTAGSTSIRMYEMPLREAAAAARVRLCMVAAGRWDVAAEACDAQAGFVVHEGKRLRFAELAADAASQAAPDAVPLRMTSGERLSGQSLPRLDAPAKLDGSVTYAADIRLPGMVHAAMRQGPIGNEGYRGGDRAAVDRVPGVTQLIETGSWVAAIGTTSWAAERGLEALRPRFATRGPQLDDADVARALDQALKGSGDPLVARGDLEQVFAGAMLQTATYSVAPAIHASLEPVTATAQWQDGRLVIWRFQVAQSRESLDEQLKELRTTLIWAFAVLGVGLIVLAALQTIYGLWPLRRVRSEVVAIRSGARTRIPDDFPDEIQPLAQEINMLLAHNEEQAEEARRHAGNLAHALKTPLTVITNAATARDAELHDTVCREATTMRRQVDHHLARARAIGRRASAQARAHVWESLEAVQRAVTRMHEGATVDIAGDKEVQVRVERQDLDEMLGNLVENAAKYGSGRVFVTVEKSAPFVDIIVEDEGPGIPPEQRAELFTRGKRLDTTGKPGTGLGLAIVRDVAEIYGGRISLDESEDLGGLLARLSLPMG